MASHRRCVALTLAVTGLAVLAAACSDTTGLPTANLANTVDTVSLFLLRDDSVAGPSAYVLQGAQRVRTDQSAVFDFAFDIDSVTQRWALKPTKPLHLGTLSSMQRGKAAFDSIKVAPTGGWVYDSAFVVDSGSVLLVRSRPITCLTGITVSLYAKLEVLKLDPAARRLDFQILVDQNCGYRGLQPGLPKQ